MQVKPELLRDHLSRKGLARCHLIYGPEPLQARESVDLVRAAARAAGAEERLVFDPAEQGWAELRAMAGTLSLFATRRLIEIRLGARKPNQEGITTIQALVADQEAPDTLLITAGELDRQQLAAAWVRGCDEAGVVTPCLEPDDQAFRRWLTQRSSAQGLKLDAEAIEFLAQRAEGNLLAAAQEIDKLELLAETNPLGVEAVQAAVTDTARYDTFQCIDAALAGQGARTVRILRGLAAEGNDDPVFICWALNKELRILVRVAAARATGTPLEQAFEQQRVWSSRQALLRQSLQRHPIPRLSALLEASIRIDRLIKGGGIGNVWDELETALLALAGGPWLGHEHAIAG